LANKKHHDFMVFCSLSIGHLLARSQTMFDRIVNWFISNPEIPLFIAWGAATVAGAVLPADNKFGQWCRRWAADLKSKRLPGDKK
jgi:hypothetical protein